MMATVIARASPTNVTQCRRCACERSLRPGRSPFTIQHEGEIVFSKVLQKGLDSEPIYGRSRCTLPHAAKWSCRYGRIPCASAKTYFIVITAGQDRRVVDIAQTPAGT